MFIDLFQRTFGSIWRKEVRNLLKMWWTHGLNKWAILCFLFRLRRLQIKRFSKSHRRSSMQMDLQVSFIYVTIMKTSCEKDSTSWHSSILVLLIFDLTHPFLHLDETNSSWAIPISLTTSKEPGAVEHSTLLNEADMVLFLDDSTTSWIKMNPGQIGFYRTLYSTEMLEALIPGIKTLTAVDRLGKSNIFFKSRVQ